MPSYEFFQKAGGTYTNTTTRFIIILGFDNGTVVSVSDQAGNVYYISTINSTATLDQAIPPSAGGTTVTLADGEITFTPTSFTAAPRSSPKILLPPNYKFASPSPWFGVICDSLESALVVL